MNLTPSTISIIATILLLPLGAGYLAPRSVRYYLKWKTSQKRNHLVLSVLLGLFALLFISGVYLINLQLILQSKFPW